MATQNDQGMIMLMDTQTVEIYPCRSEHPLPGLSCETKGALEKIHLSEVLIRFTEVPVSCLCFLKHCYNSPYSGGPYMD